MIIDSKPSQVGALLEGKYFQIPRYQRPYSWERSHLEDFWQDAIQERGDDEYFIGSIVTARPRKELVHLVVDGQQRLTTITVLLCVLRDAFEKQGNADLADGTHTLVERRNRENRQQYVLTTETSYPYLQEHVQRRGEPELESSGTQEDEALKAAKEFFVGRIDEVIQAIRGNRSISKSRQEKEISKRLKQIRDQLLSLQVIFVELENEDDAYLVFETLNTRGKDLRATDLVKNLVLRLKRPTNAGVDVAKDKWNSILGVLEESAAGIRVDAFLHHSWLSRREFVAQKKLFLVVKEEVTKSNVDQYLNELVLDAKLYRVLYEVDFREKWQQQEFAVRNALEAVDHFGVRISVPLILALLRDWQSGGITIPSVRETMKAIESFHFIFNAVTEQRATGGLAMMFASLAYELSTAPPNKKAAVCKGVRKKLRERLPGFEAFKLGFKSIVFTKSQTKQKSLVKYILARISEHMNWQIDRKDSTIEHLKPQSSGAPEDVVGQIGNLILVPPKLNNEKLADKDVASKIAVLKKAKYPIPDAMENAREWNEGAIVGHTDELASLSYHKIWTI